jgi:glutathione S-transferase
MAAPLRRRVDYELLLNLGYIDERLRGRHYLLGDALSAADVQMSFVGELAVNFVDVSNIQHLDAWVARFQARPAYRRAIERGGPYQYAKR